MNASRRYVVGGPITVAILLELLEMMSALGNAVGQWTTEPGCANLPFSFT